MDGPIRIGQSLALAEDVYSIAFVYQLHRIYIEDDFSDIEEEKEVDKDGTSKDADDEKTRRIAGESFKSARITIRGRMAFVWITQLTLTYLLFNETVLKRENREIYKDTPEEVSITLARFLCGTVLHFSL